MSHHDLNLELTIYGPDALRMEIGQNWGLKVNGSDMVGHVINVHREERYESATLRVQLAITLGSFPLGIGTMVVDPEVGQ